MTLFATPFYLVEHGLPGIGFAESPTEEAPMRGFGLDISLIEAAMLVGGILILTDRGASWTFILGLSLLSIGSTRIARNIR